MSGNEPLMAEQVSGNAAPEIFALTDEQILGMEPEEREIESGSTAFATDTASARDEAKGAQAGVPVPQEAPSWLAREMKDPWVGDEARELWEGVQRAQREAAAYREAFATPEDARALKEIYPGGVAEAKSAAVRARELAEIDAVFFGAAGKPAEELRAGRTALVERLYAQDPAAFREMVEAGVRILGGAGGGQRLVVSEQEEINAQTQRNVGKPAPSKPEGAAPGSGQAGMAVPQEVVSGYREFERATNAELEKSVGATIARAMEAALPNLRQVHVGGGEGQAAPLQERLRVAVREEVETALRSDASLGEQVARVLSGRRFDEATRAQVVRLIGARAQHLVPGAVRRVVGSWTQATLGSRRAEAGAGRSEVEQRVERASSSSQRTASGDSAGIRNAQNASSDVPRRRVDYRKMSDEQILGM